MIISNQIGVIELAPELNIETITEIFVRVNSEGTALSQADFAMSKIAVNESFEGPLLRKAIDYFCHLAVEPSFYDDIEQNDASFAKSDYLPRMRWLKDVNDDYYDPTYTDMLRVAFTSEFGRGRLADLVALLSGRNFETRQYEERVVEDAFGKLRDGVHNFISQTHFERLTMILRSAGFLTNKLMRGGNAVNFAYIVYLRGRVEGLPSPVIESLVRRWYSMSILRGRYSGSPETAFDFDIRQIVSQGLQRYVESVIVNELPQTFWTGMLPQIMTTSFSTSPYFLAYQAAQAKLGDRGFLSLSITVSDLLLFRGDRHHVYPRKLLQAQKLSRGSYNQIANYVIAQSEINVAIGASSPQKYFSQLLAQCNGGPTLYGGITDEVVLRENLRAHCIPEGLLYGDVPPYADFLVQRRTLMALKIRDWFYTL